jgi:hypothetical protein
VAALAFFIWSARRHPGREVEVQPGPVPEADTGADTGGDTGAGAPASTEAEDPEAEPETTEAQPAQGSASKEEGGGGGPPDAPAKTSRWRRRR